LRSHVPSALPFVELVSIRLISTLNATWSYEKGILIGIERESGEPLPPLIIVCAPPGGTDFHEVRSCEVVVKLALCDGETIDILL
jgi:hypothetical protein